MAGRPRLYADAAAKTRAYRERQEQRLVKWDRITAEDLQAHLKRLRFAVDDARCAGDPLACSLDTITIFELLTGLSAHFEERAACASSRFPAPERRRPGENPSEGGNDLHKPAPRRCTFRNYQILYIFT